jgi:hypothetical protein
VYFRQLLQLAVVAVVEMFLVPTVLLAVQAVVHQRQMLTVQQVVRHLHQVKEMQVATLQTVV